MILPTSQGYVLFFLELPIKDLFDSPLVCYIYGPNSCTSLSCARLLYGWNRAVSAVQYMSCYCKNEVFYRGCTSCMPCCNAQKHITVRRGFDGNAVRIRSLLSMHSIFSQTHRNSIYLSLWQAIPGLFLAHYSLFNAPFTDQFPY